MVAARDRDEFVRPADPFRREPLAHRCRMPGPVDEAEDLARATYPQAWRSCDGSEGRASGWTWLRRIATGTCLTALESRTRRPRHSGLGATLRGA
jgi:RNA polymerase sigma-70 factor (ECF subfamily)